MSTETDAPKIIWNERYQNWPGRLAWVEARIAEGRIPDGYQVTMNGLKAEREMLVAARDEWELAVNRGHLWPCGCLRNDAGAHRVGCPDHPEGVRG